MKILYITNIPSPYRVDYFNELGKYCELTVAFERKSANDRDERWQHSAEINYKAIYLKGIKVNIDKAFCPSIKRLLKQDWDCIVTCGYITPTVIYATSYLKRHKIPFFTEVDGGMIKPDKKLIYLIKRHLISRASYWFSTGKTTTDYLVHYGAKRERCFVYPFTSLHESDLADESLIENQIENRTRIRQRLRLKNNKIVLYVGQLIPRKGIDLLLEAAKDLDSTYSIYIIGGNPTQEYLELKKECKNAKVEFLDFKTKKELIDWYQAADMLVLPTREDNWGLVVNEALAQGLPVVTTNKCVAGLEIVEGKHNGVIINVDSPEELKNAIIKTCDEKMNFEFSKNALSVAREYTFEKMVEAHIKAFDAAVKEMRN